MSPVAVQEQEPGPAALAPGERLDPGSRRLNEAPLRRIRQSPPEPVRRARARTGQRCKQRLTPRGGSRIVHGRSDPRSEIAKALALGSEALKQGGRLEIRTELGLVGPQP